MLALTTTLLVVAAAATVAAGATAAAADSSSLAAAVTDFAAQQRAFEAARGGRESRLAAFLAREEARDGQRALKAQLRVVEHLFNRDPRVRVRGVQADPRQQQQLGENSTGVECALCGIAVNEVFGFLVENRSQTDIEALLKSDLCAFLPDDAKVVCDKIVGALPFIVKRLENRWDVSGVCMDLNLCSTPFNSHKDPEPMPSFTFDLDLPPVQRWTKICSMPDMQAQMRHLVWTMAHLTANNGKLVSEFGDIVNDYFPTEYAGEVAGCAAALGGGVTKGWMSLINIGYEISDACTSIVAQNSDGQVYHARNLDFWSGYWLTAELRASSFELAYQKGGKTLYTTSTFPGFSGALSGIKPGTMSVTIDTRFYPGGPKEFLYEIIAAMTERNASLVTFLSRDTLALTPDGDWEAAVNRLANTELIADVYYTTAGTKPGEGAVISRNRLNATDIWRLNPAAGHGRGKNWLLETNYDHWKPAPWFDDRRGPGDEAMSAIPSDGFNLDSLMKVASTKPVLNLQTVYTILAHPASGEYKSYRRYCGYGKDGGGCTQ